jgi:hypothetical protein
LTTESIASASKTSFQHSWRKRKDICKDCGFEQCVASLLPLVDNSTTPLRARNLHSSAHSQPNTRVSEQSSIGTTVKTQVKVEVGTVLVGSGKAILTAERISRCGAQVGDLNDDAVAGVGELVAAAVGVGGEFPAGAAAGSCACSGADAEGVLRKGGRVTGLFLRLS